MLKGVLKSFQTFFSRAYGACNLANSLFLPRAAPKNNHSWACAIGACLKIRRKCSNFLPRASGARGIVNDPFATGGVPKTIIRVPVRFARCLKNHQKSVQIFFARV